MVFSHSGKTLSAIPFGRRAIPFLGGAVLNISGLVSADRWRVLWRLAAQQQDKRTQQRKAVGACDWFADRSAHYGRI
jgi:hypothetical protein